MTATTTPSFHAVVRALLPARGATFVWQVLAAVVVVACAQYWGIARERVPFEVMYVLAYAFIGGYGPMNRKSSQALSTHLSSLGVSCRRTEWAHVVITLSVPVVLAVGALIAWPFAAGTVWRYPLAVFVMTPALAAVLSAEEIVPLHTLRGRAFFRAAIAKVGLYVGGFLALYTLGNHWVTFLPAITITVLAGWNLRCVVLQETECYV